jgi:hypothetical protein
MDLMLNGTYDLDWEPPPGTKPDEHFTSPATPHAAAHVPNQPLEIDARIRRDRARQGRPS